MSVPPVYSGKYLFNGTCARRRCASAQTQSTGDLATHLGQLYLEHVDLGEEENYAGPQEPPTVDDGFKQDQALLHPVLRALLKQDLNEVCQHKQQ